MLTTNSETLVYSPLDVMKLLGLSRSAVYDHIADGTIPSVRIGGRLLVPRKSLERLLAEADKAE